MNKVYDALNKLYFALGESNGLSGKDAETFVSMSEYFAFCALRDYERDRANGRSRYFLMGVSSAHRKAAKPPRGKRAVKRLPGKVLPAGGKNV
jgi:hypothetical protein